MKATRALLPFVALLATIAWTAVIAGAQQSARAFIQETTDEVLVVLKDGSLPSKQKLRRIEDIAYARFDFDTISRLVLARNWRKLSPEQQQQFIEEFKRHLSVTYGRNIENYRNETIEITGDREEARGDWTVKTKVLRSDGDDILVDYRLRKSSDDWKVIDVVIERVSLVANFRSQLQDIIASRGPDEMLRLLREKNASGESILPNEGKPESGAATRS
ncbi:MAG: ABC transporter substrate-binding protein [Thermodesulfobacteriota bacterium]